MEKLLKVVTIGDIKGIGIEILIKLWQKKRKKIGNFILVTNYELLIKHLNKNKIPFGRHYPYPLHKLKALKNIFKNKKFPNSEYLASNGLSIPIDPLLKSSDIKKICSVLNKFN